MHNSLTSPILLEYVERGVKLGRDPEDLFTAVAGADVISVTIGFNDAGSPDPNTIPALRTAYEANLDGILSRIVELRGGKPTAIRVTNIYNNGGSAWTAVVEATNEVACAVAKRHDAICVDIYTPFMGPDDLGPVENGYLGADMTHPSQRGMEVIADSLGDVGYAPLR
jgi:lysophospholipase L1-like esterase